MPSVHVDATICLSEDLPALQLRRGDQGIVVSIWFAPGDLMYEVEFKHPAGSAPQRVLLRLAQMAVVQSNT